MPKKKSPEPTPVTKTSKELESLQKILTILKQGDVNRQEVGSWLLNWSSMARGQSFRRMILRRRLPTTPWSCRRRCLENRSISRGKLSDHV